MLALIQRLRDKPFWYDNVKNRPHGVISNVKDCCFNHIIGLPMKHGVAHPIYDYEIMIIQAMEEPAYINSREPTEEERQEYNQKLLDAETIAKEKHGSILNIQQKIRDEKNATWIHPERVGHCLILKSAGLGITTLFLRYIAWICLRDDRLKGQDIVIITGPREQIAIDAITRLRQTLSSLQHNI